VVVASGVFRLHAGNITVTKESITIKSSFGAKGTIIQGRRYGPVISFLEDSQSVLDGFTITSIDDENAGALKGGGIYCAPSSSPTIMNNIITGNTAVFGGGIFCAEKSSPTVRNNVLSYNNVVGSGGGIFCDNASPDVMNNRIVGNEAATAGGGFFCYKGTPQVINTIFWNNKAITGGGISCDKSSCTIINSTIVKNDSAYGAGIFFDGGAVRIINNIIWANQDDLFSEKFATASRPDHSNIENGDFRGINGNIARDPLFVNMEKGDFHLTPGSPCKDTGKPDSIYDDSDGSTNDMGAYGGPGAKLWAPPADFVSAPLLDAKGKTNQ
jgi:hypothetical protein